MNSCQLVTVALAISFSFGAQAQQNEQSQLQHGIPPKTVGSRTVLSGVVRLKGGDVLEGVLVSVKKAESNMTFTVVSDSQGRYGFPSAKLDSGEYIVSIRASGYDLISAARVTVAEPGTSTLDLTLQPAKDVSTQLSNVEWIESVPGTTQQKKLLVSCVGCHTLERVLKAKYDVAGWEKILKRMKTWGAQTGPFKFVPRSINKAENQKSPQENEAEAKDLREKAQWLSTIDFKTGAWKYKLKPLPRLSGQSTRVIITEYNLPRPQIMPHDVVVDSKGSAWYCDFTEQAFGKLDPKTGKVQEYGLPVFKNRLPPGSLSVRLDKDENLWFGMLYQAAIAKFDTRSEVLSTYSVPVPANNDLTQLGQTAPGNMHVDGKIWVQDNGATAVHRFEPTSGRWETFQPFKEIPGRHYLYDVISDSKNNVYFLDWYRDFLGRIDAKTGQHKIFTTPTASSAPRRGMMDAQDRLWFGENQGFKIGMFDTKTELFKEWTLPTPWSAVYDVFLDKNGDAWAGNMVTDRIARLDPKSGSFVEYPLPRATNVRRMFVDDTVKPVAIWIGSNHGGSIVKLEPLD